MKITETELAEWERLCGEAIDRLQKLDEADIALGCDDEEQTMADIKTVSKALPRLIARVRALPTQEQLTFIRDTMKGAAFTTNISIAKRDLEKSIDILNKILPEEVGCGDTISFEPTPERDEK